MKLTSVLKKVAQRLRLAPRAEDEPLTGLVCAIVSVEQSVFADGQSASEEEHPALDRLRRAVESRAGGQYDGSERGATCVQWYFFARDADTLEGVLLADMRKESRFRGALLRVTSNGVVGPWRETRV